MSFEFLDVNHIAPEILQREIRKGLRFGVGLKNACAPALGPGRIRPLDPQQN